MMLMEIEVVPELPSVPDLETANALCAERLRYVRLRSGMGLGEWAARWGAHMDRRITPELVLAWERPDGPKPLMQWSIMALALGAPEVLHWSSRLLLPPSLGG
jgi:hypothetical protein